MRWWLRSCSKCGGDLFEEEGNYGRFIQCFQCGRILPQLEEIGMRRRKTGASGSGLTREKVLARIGAQEYHREASEEKEPAGRDRAA